MADPFHVPTLAEIRRMAAQGLYPVAPCYRCQDTGVGLVEVHQLDDGMVIVRCWLRGHPLAGVTGFADRPALRAMGFETPDAR